MIRLSLKEIKKEITDSDATEENKQRVLGIITAIFEKQSVDVCALNGSSKCLAIDPMDRPRFCNDFDSKNKCCQRS